MAQLKLKALNRVFNEEQAIKKELKASKINKVLFDEFEHEDEGLRENLFE